MTLTLEVTGPQAATLGAASRKVFDAAGGTIGRLADNTWALPDPYVSSRHAVIRYRDGTLLHRRHEHQRRLHQLAGQPAGEGPAARVEIGRLDLHRAVRDSRLDHERRAEGRPRRRSTTCSRPASPPRRCRGRRCAARRSSAIPLASRCSSAAAAPRRACRRRTPRYPEIRSPVGEEVDPLNLLGFEPSGRRRMRRAQPIWRAARCCPSTISRRGRSRRARRRRRRRTAG